MHPIKWLVVLIQFFAFYYTNYDDHDDNDDNNKRRHDNADHVNRMLYRSICSFSFSSEKSHRITLLLCWWACKINKYHDGRICSYKDRFGEGGERHGKRVREREDECKCPVRLIRINNNLWPIHLTHGTWGVEPPRVQQSYSWKQKDADDWNGTTIYSTSYGIWFFFFIFSVDSVHAWLGHSIELIDLHF